MRLKPVIDQRFDGIFLKQPSHKTKSDKQLFLFWWLEFMGSAKKNELVEELLPDEGATFATDQ